jgi:hypothetical protein
MDAALALVLPRHCEPVRLGRRQRMGGQSLSDAGSLTPFVMPAKAGIQYSVTLEINISGAAYWIIRFHG